MITNKLNEPLLTKFQKSSIRFSIPETVKTPWFKVANEDGLPTTLDYFDGSMIDAIEASAMAVPKKAVAYNFYGNKVTYKDFILQVHITARALVAYGVKPGDRVTVCMPNTPQALVMFYACNRMGAVASMIHPLSGEEEIVNYINNANSVLCLTLLQFYPKFEKIMDRLSNKNLVICDITDGLVGAKRLLFPLTRKGVKPLPKSSTAIKWKDFILGGKKYHGEYIYHAKSDEIAAILYSGGTTGTSKGILLTNLNFNALALQTGTAGDCIIPGHTMLSIMPVFHGFGLGVCIHTILYWGCTCILVPQFNVKTYCGLLKKYKPNLIAGVPTLYEALLRIEDAKTLDLSQLEGMFSGGDSLSVELKTKVDEFITAHGAKEQVREGYGTTECVTASCLTPRFKYKEGSIGIPFPDTYYKIVMPSTHEEVPYGTIGEICIAGPTVMQGYMNNPKETAQTLQLHEDGLVWLHTGDLGTMDDEGFVYFKQRLKRMIITSGYNVYPSQIENVLDSHPDVHMSTVIGVKDNYRMQKVKAIVVLKQGVEQSEEIKKDILAYCSERVAKYAVPRELEFRADLPKTLVGKVAYTVLEREEEEKQKKENKTN